MLKDLLNSVCKNTATFGHMPIESCPDHKC